MFSTPGAIEAQTNRVTIKDFDGSVVKQLVDFIQTTKLDESLQTSARDLLLIADKYDVHGLKILAQDRLMYSLSIENVCATLQLALYVPETKKLRTACIHFIASNHQAILQF